MENLHSMEFEKYKKYLISTWLPEYEAEHTERDLMVEGWNMLLDEDLGGNKVYDLSKRSFNVKVMTINQIRKQQFLALSEEMINNSKGMGREIIKSGEPYEVQILKGDQTAKRRR